MICSNPKVYVSSEFPCGKCDACRVNRVRIWVTRMLLEAGFHTASSFVTLTYNEDHYPDNCSVNKHDVQLFMRRLRDRSDSVIRYFAVGEYGDVTNRAHYHIALFGIDDGDCIARSWCDDKGCPIGYVDVGTLTMESISYICSYINKGMTKDDDKRLAGRNPEFALMSRRPGIGFKAVPLLSNVLTSYGGAKDLASNGDVFGVIRFDRKLLPIGKYLKTKLKEAVGVDTSNLDLVERRVRRSILFPKASNLDRVSSGRKAGSFVRSNRNRRKL